MSELENDLTSNELIKLEFQGNQFSIQGDYWDATTMCQAYGKRVNNFLRLDATQRYLAALSKKLGIPIEIDGESKSAMTRNQGVEDGIAQKSALIYRSKGGKVEESGTLVHRRVALKLAAWLNPDLEVWVYGVIEKLLTEGEVKLKDELKGLQAALNQTELALQEIEIELAQTSHELDQARYERDELQEIANWKRDNCWEADVEYVEQDSF
ncbi:MAG: KilA-N domain-containing protein [Symploca sp. SIO2G7]|nr:KilA-N domain-containing protein [Symploca sp. SIO2G7]